MTRLHDPTSRLRTFESLYEAIERGENVSNCAVDDEGFLAGVQTDPRDHSVVYAERLPDEKYVGVLIKPSFSKRMPTPMEHIRNPGSMPERLTHCTVRVVSGELGFSEIRSTREVRAAVHSCIRHGRGERTETYQTVHNRGQLGNLYERFVLTPRRRAD